MSWLSNAFGGNKKRDTTYTGQKPVMSLSEVQGGKPYYDMVLSRTQGSNVGFGPEYASTYANPIVKNMRNQFTSYQMPELTSELSATGRRRSSGGFDQIRRAYQEQGLAEGDIFSRLQQRNEDQSRTEINDALARLGQYAQNEANLVGERAAFDVGDYTRQLGIAENQRAQGAANTKQLIGAATTFLPYSGAGAGMASYVSPSSNNYLDKLLQRSPNFYTQKPLAHQPSLATRIK